MEQEDNVPMTWCLPGISDQINSMSLHSRPVCFCFMVVKMNTNKFMSSTSKVFCFSEWSPLDYLNSLKLIFSWHFYVCDINNVIKSM